MVATQWIRVLVDTPPRLAGETPVHEFRDCVTGKVLSEQATGVDPLLDEVLAEERAETGLRKVVFGARLTDDGELTLVEILRVQLTGVLH